MARRSFSREFKLEAVRLVSERGLSVAQAARDLDLHENVLRKWVRQYRDDPAHAFPGAGQMKPEQAEIAELKKEIRKLKAERDILKKAAVSSSRQRNTLIQSICGGSIVQSFARPLIQSFRHFVELCLRVHG